MTSTTYAEFDGKTEAMEVAKAFDQAIRGKNILVTGVNRGGIGFTTAQAFVGSARINLRISGLIIFK